MAHPTIPYKTLSAKTIPYAPHASSPAAPVSASEMPLSEELTPCALIGGAVQRIDAAAGACIDSFVEDALCSIADAAADYLSEMYRGISDFIEGRIDDYD